MEALQALHAKITNTHGRVDHVVDERAAAGRKASESTDSATSLASPTAFERIQLGLALQQAAQRQAACDEAALQKARTDERNAVHAREEAEATAKASQAAADALQPPSKSHKKQKTAFLPGSISQQP